MSTTTLNFVRTMPRRSLQMMAGIFVKEAKYEFLKLLRLPTFSLTTLMFPVMFYVLFGLILGPKQTAGFDFGTYLLATYGTFGAMGISLFGFGVSLAVERGQGWLQLKRASPMPPAAYFTAKLAMCMLFTFILMCIMLTLGFVAGSAHITAWQAAKLVAVLVPGAVPFAAMGMAIGCFVRPNSAAGVVNMIYLPLSFCSGLWIPMPGLPKFLQQFAIVLPPYHLSELALNTVGMGGTHATSVHVGALAVFTAICLVIARKGLQKEDPMY